MMVLWVWNQLNFSVLENNLFNWIKKLIKSRNSFLNSSQWKGSSKYWNDRYKGGGNSGAGSYNRLAEFKAKILNDFVKENDVNSVIEWGCGDGNQLSLAKYPLYWGYDVSEQAIKICKIKFKKDKIKNFLWCGGENTIERKADLAISLDVLYHLIEDAIFDAYMHRLFKSANKYVIIYSCNYDDNTVATHVKCRNFTSWVESNEENWCLNKIIKNEFPYNNSDPDNTSWSDFYIYHKK